MTGEGRRDVLLVALAVSLAAHVATMFWMRPKVMSSIAAGVARTSRRLPMTVTPVPPQPEPVAVEAVADLAPDREAPTSEETTPLPSAEWIGAETDESAVLSPPDIQPPPLDLSPAEAVPEKIELRTPAEQAEPEPPPVMISEATAFAPAAAPDLLLSESSAPALPDLPVPAFAAPLVAAPGIVREDVPQLPEDPELQKEEFRPVEKVMAEVDEKIVEAEKAAVRDLLGARDAQDLAQAVDLGLATAKAGEYTYFKVTVTPKAAARLRPVPKDIVVLIDASGSIGKDRLKSCREAAKRILRSCTNGDDRFNLVAFRDRFAYAFTTWRPCDAASFEQGDRWLSALAAHGRTDVFATIASVLTLPRDPQRPLIALVVTDGDANAGVSDTREILSRFTRLNDGLVSVYMYGVKSSANRELIDVLTRSNRGESFIFDGWRWSAGEGLEPLSERFRDPLLTDLRLVFAADCAAEAYPTRLRNLYAGNAVEIYGRIRGTPSEVAFSLRALAGAKAYDGFFRLPLAKSTFDSDLPAAWARERQTDASTR